MIQFSTNSTAADFAKEYLRLGGKRKVVTDDNKISIRQWEDEPEKAEMFWAANVAHWSARSGKKSKRSCPR